MEAEWQAPQSDITQPWKPSRAFRSRLRVRGFSQLQVFGGKAVAEAGTTIKVVADHHQPPVPQSGFADLLAGVIGQLFGHCGVDPVGQCRVGGDQHRRRQGVVLRLRQQIRCHLVGLGGVVCDHQHFAWSRQGVDGHLAVHRLFCEGDV